MSNEKKLHTGKLARTAVTSLAVVRAGISHLGHRARKLTQTTEQKVETQSRHEEELGRILFGALNQLKGTALKVSQMLSMEAEILPEGIRRELAKGCYQVTPLNRALMHKVFKKEFGLAPEQVFASFEANSFAAASLGQVHRARLTDGTEVVVKVQYPGIAASIGSDMRMLRTMLQGAIVMSDIMPRKEIVERVMEDIEKKLAEEVDYLHEQAQLNWFCEHAKMPGIVIPRPVSSHTTARVLTMQKLEGTHLDEWLATGPSQAQRNHFGQLLFDWFLYSAFEMHCLHADPHPGNFLFMADGQLGLIDFGCTKKISLPFADALCRAWSAVLNRNEPQALDVLQRAYVDLSLIAPDLDRASFQNELIPALAEMQNWQLEAFMVDSFDFAQKSAFPRVNWEHNKVMTRYLVGVHEELPYFDRAFMGLMQLLKKMEAVVVTKNRWIA